MRNVSSAVQGQVAASEDHQPPATASSLRFDQQRASMVASQLAARGIRSQAVLRAMGTVRRELYAPAYLGEFAYSATSIPTGGGRLMPQPIALAAMLQALDLQSEHRVLEIGTGSGYACAVLAEIAAQIFTIEGQEELTVVAATRFSRDGYQNVRVRHGSGSSGWPEDAPFDAILLAEFDSRTSARLSRQLTIGGRLVMPAAPRQDGLQFTRVTRLAAKSFHFENLSTEPELRGAISSRS